MYACPAGSSCSPLDAAPRWGRAGPGARGTPEVQACIDCKASLPSSVLLIPPIRPPFLPCLFAHPPCPAPPRAAFLRRRDALCSRDPVHRHRTHPTFAFPAAPPRLLGSARPGRGEVGSRRVGFGSGSGRVGSQPLRRALAAALKSTALYGSGRGRITSIAGSRWKFNSVRQGGGGEAVPSNGIYFSTRAGEI